MNKYLIFSKCRTALGFATVLSFLIFSNTGWTQTMDPRILQQLAPNGVLNAAIYTGNFLLVTGTNAEGGPAGVSPDMAQAIANNLGVKLVLKPFKNQGEAVDAAATGECGIVLVGSDPARAERIDFAPAYVEIEATYMVPKDSRFKTVAEVDSKGVRIAVFGVGAYGLWMDRNIKNAELIRADGLESSLQLFMSEKLDALAGLKPGLITDLQKHPNHRILDGHFMTVQQAIATKKGNDQGFAFLKSFTENSKASGFVAQLISKHGVEGRLSVAPAAP